MRRRQEGFSLIELMVALGLAAILLTLSASTLRNFWLERSLEASVDETVTQLRQTQSRATGESHPLIYGLRFRPDSNAYSIVRFDPVDQTTLTDDICEEAGSRTFEDGVVVDSIAFGDGPSDLMSACSTAAAGYASGDDFIFFYARGSATAGTLSLRHTTTGDVMTLGVLPLTGRVTRS